MGVGSTARAGDRPALAVSPASCPVPGRTRGWGLGAVGRPGDGVPLSDPVGAHSEAVGRDQAGRSARVGVRMAPAVLVDGTCWWVGCGEGGPAAPGLLTWAVGRPEQPFGETGRRAGIRFGRKSQESGVWGAGPVKSAKPLRSPGGGGVGGVNRGVWGGVRAEAATSSPDQWHVFQGRTSARVGV